MNIEYSANFKKSFKKRISADKKLLIKTSQRIKLFEQDCCNALLRDHELTGKKTTLRAFSITGDIRIIYYRVGDKVIFLDIGSHNQVY